jgi:hypothetical protein
MITPLYLVSTAKRPHLRIGVLIDGPMVPRYVVTILEDIARTNFARVDLAIVLDPGGPLSSDRFPGLVHELYARVDRAVGGDRDPLALVDPGMGLADVDRLDVSPGKDGEPWLPADILDEIHRCELDVILRFCAAVPRGEVLHAARHGVWSYHFGDDEDAPADPSFFGQLEEAPTRSVRLEVLADGLSASAGGAGLVLCQSSFGSQGSLFLASYRQIAFGETTHFVVWKLHDLHERGWEYVRGQAVLPARAPTVRPGPSRSSYPPRTPFPPRSPTAGEVVRFLASRVGASVAGRVRGIADHWKIGLRRAASPFGITPEGTDLGGFRWIEPPPGHYWADPFLMERGGSSFLFFEDFDHEKDYGAIGVAEVRGDDSLGPPTACLDLEHHLSFPFVFEHGGEMFMIPESLSDGTVTLYRARGFPHDWVPEKVLFRGNAVDTTCWQEGGRFYFFTTLHERDDRGMKTLIFVADSLTGEWRLHPANPVSSDARDARNAGAVFRRDGRLFRPAQNCGPAYGYGLSLEEIVTLSEDRYEERRWCAVDARALPFPAAGIHTYNACGDLEAIDAKLGPVTLFPPAAPPAAPPQSPLPRSP